MWNEGVSTTFNFVRKLVVADMEAGRKVSRRVSPIEAKTISGKARTIKALNDCEQD